MIHRQSALVRFGMYTAILLGIPATAYGWAHNATGAHATTLCSATSVNTTDCAVDANGSFQFSPADITVTTGVTVTWENTAGFSHSTTSSPGATESWTDVMAGGESFAHAFMSTGSDPYYCTFHGSPTSGMHGSVTVVSPTAATVSRFHSSRAGGVIRFTWRIPSGSDIVAFNLRAGGMRLNHRAIETHPGQVAYHFSTRQLVRDSVTLRIVLRGGLTVSSGPYHVR